MRHTKSKGYLTYKTKAGKIKKVHSRIGEKKYGYRKIPAGFVIHHIDGNKSNNRYNNLIILHRKDHRRVHVEKSLIIKSVKGKIKLTYRHLQQANVSLETY